MKNRRLLCALVAIALGHVAKPHASSAAVADLLVSNDTAVWYASGASAADVAAYNGYIGGSDPDIDNFNNSPFSYRAFGYFQFDLSTLNIETIDSAEFSIQRMAINPSNNIVATDAFDVLNDVASVDRVDFYGLNSVAGNTAQDWSESTLSFNTTGNELTAASIASGGSHLTTGTVEDFSGQDSVAGQTVSLSGPALTTWLQTRLDDNGLATIISINPQGALAGSGLAYHSSNGALGFTPSLNLVYTVAIPEPTSAAILGITLSTVLLRRRRR
ncbi:hypothetical protein LF1_02490 [Rubripirellula obstinata]|uniref:PEP-CTERM protein-sorting domain-containing protein n=1 Tax=Rubripirellula obstinata TaxID=406547 RepID=A0A5B1CDD0_9BACT|nr:PEP-CTERM sorting domain-containing protein [Rubripirellula obstinata]KAA1257759.1 hypothetical protein LF1_02490 [Rubripirellula obstinata]